MIICDHVIGFSQGSWEDDNAYLIRMSEYLSRRDWPDEEFKFCSECGAHLELDKPRLEYEQEQKALREKFDSSVNNMKKFLGR